MGLYFDSTYVLVLIGIAIVAFAQYRVSSTFNKYNALESQRKITGRQAAEHILKEAGISNVRVEGVPGQLTDHYDPRNKVLRLSEATYNQTSVAAVAVAAHECGHAIQDAKDYNFLKFRSSLAPVIQISSSIAIPLIIFGFILEMAGLMNLGIIAFSTVLVFQLVTLPVEFDASKRALQILQTESLFYQEELPAARKVLKAAAFTYIAASISTALQLLRFIVIANRRRR